MKSLAAESTEYDVNSELITVKTLKIMKIGSINSIESPHSLLTKNIYKNIFGHFFLFFAHVFHSSDLLFLISVFLPPSFLRTLWSFHWEIIWLHQDISVVEGNSFLSISITSKWNKSVKNALCNFFHFELTHKKRST